MSNWTQMNRNLARTGGFVGKTQSQEDAYFAFFADDAPDHAAPARAIFSPLLTGLGLIWAGLRARVLTHTAIH